MKKTIITVVGKDTVGIIAKGCNYLAENQVNIEDISQTIVQGFQYDDGNGRLQEREIQRRACKRSGGAWKFHRRCHPLPA